MLKGVYSAGLDPQTLDFNSGVLLMDRHFG